MKFRNSLAFRVFNFALKVEKISLDSKKTKEIKEIEILAKLQNEIEVKMNEIFISTKNAEMALKKLKEERGKIKNG